MKKSWENCGNTQCANSIAFFRDECVESGFTKHWKPKEPEKPPEKPEENP